MTDHQAVELLRSVRMFCNPMQVQAIDHAITLLRRQIYEDRKTHPVG